VQTGQTRGGTGDHDRPAVTLFDHLVGDHADRVVDPGQHHPDRVGPAQGRLVEGLGRPGDVQDPGVGQDDVDPPELADGLLHRGVHRVDVAHVGPDGQAAPILLLDQRDGLGQVVRGGHRVADRRDLIGDVQGDDVRALLGQRHGVGPPLAAGRSGDESDLVLHPAGSLHRAQAPRSDVGEWWGWCATLPAPTIERRSSFWEDRIHTGRQPDERR
jgi:hypothetical protein